MAETRPETGSQELLVQTWASLPPDRRSYWMNVFRHVPIPPSLMDIGSMGEIGEIVNPKEMAAKVGLDPLLAAKILAIANSAALRLGNRVTTLERAIIHLGTNLVQSTVMAYRMELMLNRWPTYPKIHLNYIRNWGAGSSVLAQHCASAARLTDTGIIGTVALLARLGGLIFGLVKPAPSIVYQQVVNEVERLKLEEFTWGVSHPVLSEQLAHEWKLPENLCVMLGRASEPLLQELPDAADKGLIIAAACAALAVAFMARPKTDGRILFDRSAYKMLKANLKLHKLMEPCLATFDIQRVRRELTAATE